ncbi:alcohol dehydrogenase [Bdellovibrio bacteriovorus]|uniref:alcohol dehydrogenase n=1 Tax=Bdellovibrio bacteriovorus TaxID=959 RepID=A0A161PCZ6_BDEBC|nr:zinc-binding dehydrogenase [Bdellovibrio bacteriovorus]KYG68014.1 alcohol dehydrogenase [Bdellovibrio bacteriovorus]
MFAARYVPGEKKLSLTDIPKPRPGPRDVLLKIRAAGICHSDLHVLAGEVPYPHTFTMGHEACGEVVEKGNEVSADIKVGGLYAVHGPNPCGDCTYCRTGHDNLCNGPGRTFVGLGQDGAYADYLVVPARNVVEVPKGVSPEVAAVATDAVLTPYHAIKTLGEVQTNSKVLVIGLGGLGINGVQVAVALGAKVTATDLRESSLELAKKFGANETVNSKEIDKKIKPASFDVVIDFVGRDSTFTQAQTFVRPGGTIVLVGLGSSHVPVISTPLISYQVRVQGAFWGTHQEMHEIFQLIDEGKIKPQVETAPMKDVNHWLEELEAGRVKSRMALLPSQM